MQEVASSIGNKSFPSNGRKFFFMGLPSQLRVVWGGGGARDYDRDFLKTCKKKRSCCVYKKKESQTSKMVLSCNVCGNFNKLHLCKASSYTMVELSVGHTAAEVAEMSESIAWCSVKATLTLTRYRKSFRLQHQRSQRKQV